MYVENLVSCARDILKTKFAYSLIANARNVNPGVSCRMTLIVVILSEQLSHFILPKADEKVSKYSCEGFGFGV